MRPERGAHIAALLLRTVLDGDYRMDGQPGSQARPAVFFSNSNIVPFGEYELRRSELERYCKSFGLEVMDDEYDHQAWLETLCGNLSTDPAGLAGIPERGPRCLECFRFRLDRAAAYAAENGYRKRSF